MEKICHSGHFEWKLFASQYYFISSKFQLFKHIRISTLYPNWFLFRAFSKVRTNYHLKILLSSQLLMRDSIIVIVYTFKLWYDYSKQSHWICSLANIASFSSFISWQNIPGPAFKYCITIEVTSYRSLDRELSLFVKLISSYATRIKN